MISYIIPAYNCEETLERAVNSIINNSKVSYEILIIENGSTDKTNLVINQLAKNNPHIKLFCSNKGVSNARNKGIQEARGEWIIFVDSDDYLISSVDMNKRLSTFDLIVWNFKSGKKTKYLTKETHNYISKKDCQSLICTMLNDPTKFMTVWGKAFRTSIIQENSIWFNPNMEVTEDSYFLLNYLLVCQKIQLNSKIVYQYSVDVTSTTRSHNENLIYKYSQALGITYKNKNKFPVNISSSLNNYIALNFTVAVVRGIYSKKNVNNLKKLKLYVQTYPFKQVLKNLSIRQCSNIKLLPVIFIKYHLSFFAHILFKLRAYQNRKRENV